MVTADYIRGFATTMRNMRNMGTGNMRKTAQMPTLENNSMKHPAGGIKPSARATEGGTVPPVQQPMRPPTRNAGAYNAGKPSKRNRVAGSFRYNGNGNGYGNDSLKVAYAKGYSSTMEKLSARSLFPSGDPHYPTYDGDLSSQDFYDALDKSDGMNITPGQALAGGYPDRMLGGRVLPEVTQYRRDNPGKQWIQNLDRLDTPVFVRANPDKEGTGIYNPITNTALLDTDPRLHLNRRNWVTMHEVGVHGAQGRGAISANYVPGLVPSPADIRAYKLSLLPGREPVHNAAYYLNPVETEAFVSQLQRNIRNKQFAAERNGAKWHNAQDPLVARILLEKELRTNTSDRSPLGGLIDTFKGLTPEQQELFLDHWSGQMPGLASNNAIPAPNVPNSPTMPTMPSGPNVPNDNLKVAHSWLRRRG